MRFRITPRLIKQVLCAAIAFTAVGVIECGVFHESFKVALAPFLAVTILAIVGAWQRQRTTKQPPPNVDGQDATGGQDHRAA